MKPAVSVVIPTYNNSAFLAEAVESVQSQDFGDVEIVIVDDGSNDDTENILRRLESDDVRIAQQPNGGPAKARNLGISMAQGDWVAFLDADDHWLSGKLSAQMKEIHRCPEVGFGYTDVLFHYQNGEEKIHRPKNSGAGLFDDLLWGNQLATDSVIVRRECLDEVGGFRENLRTGEDWDLWLRLAARFKSFYLPSVLTFVRAPANRGAKYGMKIFESCTLSVLDQLFTSSDIIKTHPYVPDLRKQLYAFHYSVLAKSYLNEHRLFDWWRLAQSAVRSHSTGWRYLMPSSL